MKTFTDISACFLDNKGMAYPGYGAPPPGGYGGVSKEIVYHVLGMKLKIRRVKISQLDGS